MSRLLIAYGGSPHAHDFAASANALAALATESGHEVELVDSPDAAAERLARTVDPVDGLVVNGLWWPMTGDSYDEWRPAFGYSASCVLRRNLPEWVNNGGGLFAFHTAVICFDDWPQWIDLIGGGWRWGVSSHPPATTVTVELVGEHPITNGVNATFDVRDEVYGDLQVRGDIATLAVARRTPDDNVQPIVWVREAGVGRVAVDCLGHDVDSIENPVHARLIKQCIDWVTAEAA